MESERCPKLEGNYCTEPLKGINDCPLKKQVPLSDYRCFNFKEAMALLQKKEA
ncbi:MAG: hypothetical protein ABSD42_06845 [Candidatus Bathyarchaeia archaeon]|jgi:hypothetical protein